MVLGIRNNSVDINWAVTQRPWECIFSLLIYHPWFVWLPCLCFCSFSVSSCFYGDSLLTGFLPNAYSKGLGHLFANRGHPWTSWPLQWERASCWRQSRLLADRVVVDKSVTSPQTRTGAPVLRERWLESQGKPIFTSHCLSPEEFRLEIWLLYSVVHLAWVLLLFCFVFAL